MFNLTLDRRVHRARRAGTGEANHWAFCAEWEDSPPFHCLWANT